MILSPNRTHIGGSCAGKPRELCFAFFGIIADTLREVLGADWTDESDGAWRAMLGEIEDLVAQDES
jgi:hypothetical protein